MSGDDQPVLRLKGIGKKFPDGTVAVRDVDLDLGHEELLCFLGPSGCGKTTSLRIIAGLEEPTTGDVYLNGERITDWSPQQRNIGLVFQNYALFLHMSVRENLLFAPSVKGVPRGRYRDQFESLIDILELEDLLDTRASRLNLNAMQRVAIGRTLLGDPSLLLLDEPLNNFDPGMREEMRGQLKTWQHTFGRSMIYVTHDQEEALTLGDRIMVMRDGSIEQVGTPDEIYQRPATLFVAGFIGRPAMNIFDAGVENSELTLPDLDVRIDPPSLETGALPQRLKAGIRPEHLSPGQSGGTAIEGTVDLVRPIAAKTIVDLKTERGEMVTALVPSPYRQRPGDPTSFSFRATDLVLFDADSGRRVD